MTRPIAFLSVAALAAPVLVMQPMAYAQDDAPDRPSGVERPGQGRGGGGARGPGRAQGQDPLAGQVQVGSKIPSFAELVAYNPDGSKTTLAERVPEDGHLVIVTGCLTCPKFLMSYRDIEAVAHDYRSTDKPLAFVYVYKALAHPENYDWIQPFTLEERLAQVKAAEEKLGNKVPFICDPIDNSVSTALGGSPNSAYIVEEDGKIAYVMGWADGSNVRAALEKLVGVTEEVSTADEIGVPPFERPYRSTGSVVPRVEVSGTMIALKTEPAKSDQPFYVKLRVEVEPKVLQGQAGKMYVGFHLDPVHKVHWNNLVDPVNFMLKAPEGVEITPEGDAGPKVAAATDSDPREFLLDVTTWPQETPIEFEVHYFACSDKEGWCKPVTQNYTVTLERDPAGGMAQARWQRGGGRPGAGPGGGGGPDPIARMDTDGDGKIAKSEAPGPMQQRFTFFDTDGNGFIEGEELDRLRERMQGRGRGQGGRGGGGGRPSGGDDT